ncbi:MAG: LysR family transcriptional regulator substrate-binding protein, partial [Oscillospiraceae bacterium]|nr:LysR family transcriptional regulator substrate-binding protein [Oscillospiraceae bacterium]
SKEIEFTPLKNFTAHAYIRKGHPLSENRHITMQQLEPYTCIAYEQDNNSLNFAEETVDVSGFKKVVYVRDRATAHNIIANTDSYNIGTGCLIDGIVEKDIVSLPLEGYNEKMTVGWIKLKNMETSPVVEDFIEHIKNALTLSYTGVHR